MSEFGDGWALFGRVLLVREGCAGPLPVAATRLEVHPYVARRSWPRVVERCAEDGESGGSGRWLGAPQVAQVLGVSDRTVRVWVQAGRFPPSACAHPRPAIGWDNAHLVRAHVSRMLQEGESDEAMLALTMLRPMHDAKTAKNPGRITLELR